MDEVSSQPRKLGANAIWMTINYENVGEGTMLMVCISGTAVVVE